MKPPYPSGADALMGSGGSDTMDDGAMGAPATTGPVSGVGVVHDDYGDTAEQGYTCEGKFPLGGGFFTRKPKGGEA